MIPLCRNNSYKIQQEPQGDRSHEYNEHFRYKLDFLVNQKAISINVPIGEISPKSEQEAKRPYIKHSLGVQSAILQCLSIHENFKNEFRLNT